MEDRKYIGSEYTSGSYHSEGKACREDDDYWIFWSKRRFLRYFVDGVKELDPIEADSDKVGNYEKVKEEKSPKESKRV